MNIIEIIKEEIIKLSEEYKNTSLDKFDFWNEHVKYVYEEAVILAKKYDADLEIVSLGALLHDIALIKNVGTKKDHHINGKIIANEILNKYSYPKDKLERVLGCVYNHRSSKNATNMEELCVADSDILAHFDNIEMLYNLAINKHKINNSEISNWIKDCLNKDYDDLSTKTKQDFKEQYKLLLEKVYNNEFKKKI